MRPAISSFVRAAVERVNLPARATVLDLGCGFGRHSVWLANLGHHVLAADIDESRLDLLVSAQRNELGKLLPICVDAARAIPIKPQSLDMVVIVDLVVADILERVAILLRRGGFLIYETIGSYGENWRHLPELGKIRAQIQSDFDLLQYIEKPSGPAAASRATVKVLSQRFC